MITSMVKSAFVPASDGHAPHFAIVMPAYNAALTVAQSIESVLAQTWQDWELVIVDDGSGDDTYAVACAAAENDSRIRVYRQANRGPGPARGAAADATTAPYLCRLDADDLYYPEYLETFAAFMGEHPGYDIYSCNADSLSPDGSRGLVRPAAEGGDGPRSWILEEMLQDNMIFSMAVMTRDIYAKVGGFREGVDVEDYDFWLRAMVRGARHIYNPAVLGLYRLHPRQMTANPMLLESQVSVMYEMVRNRSLTDRERDVARESLGRSAAYLGVLRRWNLDTRLRRRETACARRDFWAARRGYHNPFKFVAAGAVMLLSPHLYTRLFLGGSPESGGPVAESRDVGADRPK